jgi:hypothetical protein
VFVVVPVVIASIVHIVASVAPIEKAGGETERFRYCFAPTGHRTRI